MHRLMPYICNLEALEGSLIKLRAKFPLFLITMPHNLKQNSHLTLTLRYMLYVVANAHPSETLDYEVHCKEIC